jgi:hypothetical protein
MLAGIMASKCERTMAMLVSSSEFMMAPAIWTFRGIKGNAPRFVPTYRNPNPSLGKSCPTTKRLRKLDPQ